MSPLALRPARRVLGVLAAASVALVALAAHGCGPARPAAMDPRTSLEAQLSALPPSTDASVTARRAALLRALGRQDDALAELEKAANAARDRVDWSALAASERAIGDLEVELGRPQRAAEAYGKRLEAAAALQDPVARGRALVDTGYALALLGSVLRADDAIAEAQILAGPALFDDPLTVEHLARTADRLGDERAGEWLERARRGFLREGDAAGAARVAVDRAGLALRAGAAEPTLDALEPEASGIPDRDALARLRRFQADAALAKRSWSLCESRAGEAVELADRRRLAQVSKLARVTLARCAGELGDTDRAIAAAEEAAMLVEQARQELTGATARQEAAFEAFRIYRLLLELETKLPEPARSQKAFVTTERARARAHLDAVAMSRAGLSLGADASPALAEDRAEAAARVRRLTQELATHRSDPTLAERHRDALWALEDVEDAIRENDPLVARLPQPEPATIDDARRALVDDKTLLVSYFVTEDRVVAIGIDRTSARLEVLRSPPDALGKLLHAYRRALVHPERDVASVRALGQKVYDEVLGPFDAEVRAHEALVVLPHGDLGSIPFEALVDRDGKFLVEKHEVAYGLSATLAIELAKRSKPEGKRRAFVGMGDPVYDWAGFQGGHAEGSPAGSRGLTLWTQAAAIAPEDERRPLLPRLPGTSEEVRAIAKLFGRDADVYLRDRATEENVKAGALGHHRIVHIASHGLLDPHYQALALTLNPASKEDGFLLQDEIAQLDLDADLVVLSACQTGATHMRDAEPVAGLALALRAAGAERVVVSLWSVDDAATAKLMTDFYGPLVREGTSYRASLAAAKRAMIARGQAHPYFWAPFVLLGN